MGSEKRAGLQWLLNSRLFQSFIVPPQKIKKLFTAELRFLEKKCLNSLSLCRAPK